MLKSELNPFQNEQWRKGGMSVSGLRMSTEVRNYFPGPGRQNLIPDPNAQADLKTDNPSFTEPVSSIGWYQVNGNKEVAASEYGPGTLKSTNLQVRNPAITDENTMGYVMQNANKTQFVDYRSTADFLVDNLRRNPLSIYAVGDAKDAPIPAFFSYVQPQNYATYKSEPEVDIKKTTVTQAIDGSPQINILGLQRQNPFMGLTSDIPNTNPEFELGKTYGGSDNSSAKPYADYIYNQGWTTNTLEPIQKEAFGEELCKNKALVHFAQGYNIAPQINENKMIEWVGNNKHGVDNIPWGPKDVTQNPWTQQGGLWLKGNNPRPTEMTEIGYRNNPRTQMTGHFTVPYKNYNYYKNGLPGSIVASEGP